jgi:hypothetical protein
MCWGVGGSSKIDFLGEAKGVGVGFNYVAEVL